jgi:hypothetical protein
VFSLDEDARQKNGRLGRKVLMVLKKSSHSERSEEPLYFVQTTTDSNQSEKA